MREILLLFAVPSGSRWPYRASASRFLLQRAFRRRPWRLTGGQAGPPAPAACAKYYCYSQSPPAAVGLIEPARVASCSSALFAAVHGGSLGPLSLSVIFLIALNIKTITLSF
nr:hypothetical protein [Yersinia enterocolitica]